MSKTVKIVAAAALIVAFTATIILLMAVSAKSEPKAPEVRRSEDEEEAFIGEEAAVSEIRLPILMYHNVIPSKYGSKYEITVDGLRRDFEALKDGGYTVVSADSVIAYASGAKIAMPDKPVMLSFDDGFYNYNKFLAPMLEEFGYSAVVGVVGDFTKFNKNTDATPNYTYVDYDDIKALSDGGAITIANHSNAMHYLKNGKKGVMPTYGENSANYRERFMNDTLKMQENLSKIGIKPSIYVYPYGLFNDTSEEVLSELGYVMTLTCSERVNTIKSGDLSTLKLLGRYNRDGRYGIGEVLRKFDKI